MSFTLNFHVPPPKELGGQEKQVGGGKRKDWKKLEKTNVSSSSSFSSSPPPPRHHHQHHQQQQQHDSNDEEAKQKPPMKTTSLNLNDNEKRREVEQAVEQKNDNNNSSSNNAAVAVAVNSRKHPITRPKASAPRDILEQVTKASKLESTSELSTNFLSQEKTFHQLNLNEKLVEHVLSKEKSGLGLVKPSKVQEQLIPLLLLGNDAVVKAETGSGKTLSYVLPILTALVSREKRMSREDGIAAIVLAPTRELCLQIYDVFLQAGKPFHWLICSAVVGGEKRKSEKARIRKGVNILIATPGRLADHLRTTETLQISLTKKKLKWLVLDEADRLMDSGFEKQVEEILTQLKQLSSEEHLFQTVLLSATISKGVERLIGMSLRNPVKVEVVSGGIQPPKDDNNNVVAGVEEAFAIPKQLIQHYVLVESKHRFVSLVAYLRKHIRRTGNTSKMIVFVASRACVEFLFASLNQIRFLPPTADSTQEATTPPGIGTKLFMLHGSLPQNERKRTIQEFLEIHNGAVLLCTDVAARGLDIPNVDFVIQYDPPSEISDYIHRIGRTARQGRRGTAVIFLRESELEYVNVLKKHHLMAAPLQLSFDSLLPPTKERVSLSAHDAMLNLQSKFAELTESKLLDLAKAAYTSYVGAYSVHSSETKSIFVPRLLHLGHVATSFGLKEPPSVIGKDQTNAMMAKKKRKMETPNNANGNKNELDEDEQVKRVKFKQALRKKIDHKNEFAAE